MLKFKKIIVANLLISFMAVGFAFAGTIIQPWILQSYNGIPGQLGQDVNGTPTVTGNGFNVNGPVGPIILSTAAVITFSPIAAGELIIVSSPQTFNVGSGFGLCLSTGTGVGAVIQVSSATTALICR